MPSSSDGTRTPLNFFFFMEAKKKGISLSERKMKDFLVLEIEDNYEASLRCCCMLRFCVCMTEQRNEGEGNTDDSTPTHPSIHPSD